MLKKPADKKTKKTVKAHEKPTEEVASKEPSTIESLPKPQPVTVGATPAVEAANPSSPDIKLVLNPTSPTATTPTPTVVTPEPTTIPTTPVAPSITPDIMTEPDPTTGVTTDSLTSAEPSAAISATSPVSGDGTDDFEPEHGGSGLRILLIFITALLVGGAAVGGFFYYSQIKTKEPPKNVKSETPVQAPTAAPTEPVASESAQKTDAATLSVQILNGSGTAGEAARVRDELQKAGFEKFSLGNADSYDYTDTEVQVKEGLPGTVFESIQKSLSAYTVVEESALPTSSSYDVVINVGKKK